MSNNKEIELVKRKIEKLVVKNQYEEDKVEKIQLYEEELLLRKRYHYLLKKKRPMLLTFALVFCIFYGISLAICLPPYVIRGNKMDINEKKMNEIKTEIACLQEILAKEQVIEVSEPKITEDVKQENAETELEKLLKLKQLYDQGLITKEEFDKMKKLIL